MKDKKDNKKKIYVSALIAMLLGGLGLGVGQASAWGPERKTWTMDDPADYATFNSITNNTSVGDERDFVRVAEAVSEGTSTAVNELHIQGGKDYVVTIYYHNDAASSYNKVEYNYKGVAQKTRLSAAFPDALNAGEKGQVDGLIYSVTANPEEVWDEAYLIADEKVKLSYISGRTHNSGSNLKNGYGGRPIHKSSFRSNPKRAESRACAKHGGHIPEHFARRQEQNV